MKKFLVLLLLIVLATPQAWAHAINYELQNAPTSHIIWFYVQLGFTHILPSGFDHLLFVLALFIVTPRLRFVLWQATIFTIAHSITLIGSMLEIIHPPAPQVEILIAMSIVFIGVENILLGEIKVWRYLVIALFGLIHGCGFASAISSIGLPPHSQLTALAAFNIGVELGQATFIILMYSLAVKWLHSYSWYRHRIVIPVSCCIAGIAVYWVVQRTLML